MDSDATAWSGRAVGDGRYALGPVLGEGSQGATFEAVDKRDGRLVAIKRFAVRGARSWKDVELAEREADVLATLSHELLPAVLDRFEEEGALWLVMDLVAGEPLSARGCLDRAEVIAFLRDCGTILDYLHRRAPPVIHRDIKPGNVIRRPAQTGEVRDRYVLVDFGSVRQRLEVKGGSTVVGTFGYMAPEQLQGRALPATDVYAAGATALRMLTGVEPEDLPHRGLAVDVAEALPGDPALAAVLARMLVPDPDERAGRILPLLDELGAEEAQEVPPPEPSGTRAAPPAARGRRTGVGQDRAPTVFAAFWGLFIVLALAMVRVFGHVVLRFVLPTMLRLSAVLVGRQGERAARRVERFGLRVDGDLVRLRRVALGLDMDGDETDAPSRVRVDAEPEGEGTPASQEARSSMDEATEELEGALEQLAEELQEQLAGKAKKRSPPR